MHSSAVCLLVTSVLGFSHGITLHADGLAKKDLVPRKPEKTATDSWTVDDVILGESAGGFQIAPDSHWAAWVKRSPDKEKGVFVSHLMLSSLTDSKEIQLTRGVHSCNRPQWSPDALGAAGHPHRLLAFLSARPVPKGKAARDDEDDKDDKDEPKTQIWLINPFGGEPWALTDSPREVRDFAWADAETIVFVAQEKTTLREKTLKDKKDTTEVIDDEPNEPPVRLWRVTLASKKVQRLTDNTDRIQSLALSPDGRYAVTIHERSLSYTFDHKIKPAVFLYDLHKGERRQIFTERFFNIVHIRWQHDSKGFYAVNHFTNHPHFLMAYITELYHYDLTGGASKVPLNWEKGLADGGAGFAVTTDGFVALLADGVRHQAARYTRAGATWKREALNREHLVALTVARDGRTLLYEESSTQSPPRWFRARLAGKDISDAVVLTDLQAELRQRPRAKTEVVRWKGAGGEEVEGLLYYPHHYQVGQKYPLVVMIHGGPHWADFDVWNDNWAYTPNLLCARGALIFRPNYHGSSHYGLAWAESIANGKYYDWPVQDIENGIDVSIGRGLVDAHKIGLTGWSNGAILTMALITRRPYQAAAAGAGGSEWVGDWGICEFGMSFSNYYLGKAPYEDPELYRKNAPFFQFAKVRTPTLLFQGADDRVVAAHHGWLQFRALQQLGKTEVRFLLFPGEKHSLKKLAHQRRKVEEELAWFDKHLFQTVKVVNPALKDDSPLARALALKDIARHGRLYGVHTAENLLVPEVVTYKGLTLGRFEVTRAQYAQFDKTYKFEAGTDNYPADGITFAKAKAYCAWLSKVTGEEYRLGRVEEMTTLYQEVEGAENTLDHWAGYALTPEDKARLQEKIKELGSRAPLLKEVGSFPGAGTTTRIFDLGGNVAEWALAVDGSGKALGGSADMSAEERGRGRPAPEYIGLRVVRSPRKP